MNVIRTCTTLLTVSSLFFFIFKAVYVYTLISRFGNRLIWIGFIVPPPPTIPPLKKIIITMTVGCLLFTQEPTPTNNRPGEVPMVGWLTVPFDGNEEQCNCSSAGPAKQLIHGIQGGSQRVEWKTNILLLQHHTSLKRCEARLRRNGCRGSSDDCKLLWWSPQRCQNLFYNTNMKLM